MTVNPRLTVAVLQCRKDNTDFSVTCVGQEMSPDEGTCHTERGHGPRDSWAMLEDPSMTSAWPEY